MKFSYFYIYTLSFIAISFCKSNQTHSYESNNIQDENQAIATNYLTITDAQKIMGERAQLTGNSFVNKGDTLEYKCDYTTLSKDATTGKTATLYFMIEKYGGIPAAENAYNGIYQGNRGHEGVMIVPGLGNEAYYHTDQTGFYFFLVRKNSKLLRIKLNKITSRSSEKEFKAVTSRIVDKL